MHLNIQHIEIKQLLLQYYEIFIRIVAIYQLK
jgi:hypothetical protein